MFFSKRAKFPLAIILVLFTLTSCNKPVPKAPPTDYSSTVEQEAQPPHKQSGILVISAEDTLHVSSVHDGDSFHVKEFPKEVRIFGIDAPEVQPPPGTHAMVPEDYTQPLATEARDYLKTLILGKEVKLDCGHGRSHKRPICSVYVDHQDIAKEMVRKGYAFDEPHFTHQYDAEEHYAKTHHLGVWQVSSGEERPWEYRHRLREQTSITLRKIKSPETPGL